jgi:hypothetical protein
MYAATVHILPKRLERVDEKAMPGQVRASRRTRTIASGFVIILIRALNISIPNSGNTGLLSPYTKQEILSSNRLLPKRQCREQGAKVVQPKCGKARECHGVGQHKYLQHYFIKTGLIVKKKYAAISLSLS